MDFLKENGKLVDSTEADSEDTKADGKDTTEAATEEKKADSEDTTTEDTEATTEAE